MLHAGRRPVTSLADEFLITHDDVGTRFVSTTVAEAIHASEKASNATMLAVEAQAAAEKAEKAAEQAERAELVILSLNGVASTSMLGTAYLARRTYCRWLEHRQRYAQCCRIATDHVHSG